MTAGNRPCARCPGWLLFAIRTRRSMAAAPRSRRSRTKQGRWRPGLPRPWSLGLCHWDGRLRYPTSHARTARGSSARTESHSRCRRCPDAGKLAGRGRPRPTRTQRPPRRFAPAPETSSVCARTWAKPRARPRHMPPPEPAMPRPGRPAQTHARGRVLRLTAREWPSGRQSRGTEALQNQRPYRTVES